MNTHPLARLSEEEINATRELLAAAGVLVESTRFAYIGLAEPDKRQVLAGEAVPRQVRVLLLDLATGLGRDCVVDLSAGALRSVTEIDPVTGGQMPILERGVRGHRGHPRRVAGVAGRAGQTQAAGRGGARLPAVGRVVRVRQRGGQADAPGARVPSAGSHGARLGVPDRWSGGLCGPHRAHRAGRARRAGLPDPHREGGVGGAAARDPAADRDHPARGPQLHGRGRRGELGEVAAADRLRHARGADPQPDLVRRPADRLPRVDRRDGGAVRRPVAGPVLAELLRHRANTCSPGTPTRCSSAATASARSTTSTP